MSAGRLAHALPVRYVAWHDWAEAMSRTHKQRRCRGCGLLSIWEPTMPTVALPPWEHGCVGIRGLVV